MTTSPSDNQTVVTADAKQVLPEGVTVKAMSTTAAAMYLGRKPQTLRRWACLGAGPVIDGTVTPPKRLTPVRINGRLSWLIADLDVLLSGNTK